MQQDSEIRADDIEEIIKDEFEKFKNAEPSKRSPENERQSQASYKIAMAIVQAVINNSTPYFLDLETDKILLSLIKRANLGDYYAGHTFWIIEDKLTSELNKLEKDSRSYSLLETSIEHINFMAVNFFEERLVEEFKDVHIAEILFRAKRTLDREEHSQDKYFRQAVLNVKKDVERRIELRKEEKLNREQIYEPDDSDENYGIPNQASEKHKDLTLDRATLFLGYFFNFAEVECTNTAKAKVISFLTGYSETKIAQAFSRIEKEKLSMIENEELSEKFSKDVNVVRKYFKLLNLEKVLDQIDQDLETDF